jgi:hypothetical protein
VLNICFKMTPRKQAWYLKMDKAKTMNAMRDNGKCKQK